MRIAITGATGFIGGAIARRLEAEGYDVLALGRKAWDLGTAFPAPEALRTCEVVIHAAAHVAPWGPDAPFRAVTVAGTGRLLDAIDPSARLIVVGSASVYDPRLAHELAREDEAPVAPGRYLNQYARAKAAQERLVLEARPDAVVLRPRAVWGPGDTTILPRLLRRVRGDRLALPDGGRHPISTTHVSSLVAAVLAAIERREVAGPVNVADATARPGAEIPLAVLRSLGRPVRIVAVPTPLAWLAATMVEAGWTIGRRAAEPPLTRYAVAALGRPFTLDLGRLHGELGVRPEVDVEAAAADLARSVRAATGGA